jgi:hypothetical protein
MKAVTLATSLLSLSLAAYCNVYEPLRDSSTDQSGVSAERDTFLGFMEQRFTPAINKDVEEFENVADTEEAEKTGRRLIKVSESEEAQWMTYKQIKQELYDKQIRYMDITDFRDVYDDFSVDYVPPVNSDCVKSKFVKALKARLVLIL